MSPAKSCGAGPRPRGGPASPFGSGTWAYRAVQGDRQGSARGCGTAGEMYLFGQGVAPDAAKARASFEKACQGAYPPGCVNLAVMYRQGVGMPKNEALVASSPGVRSRVFSCLPGARTEACPAARRGPAGCAQNSDLRNFPNCNPRRAGQNNLAALEMTHLVRSITFYGTST